jgi:excisionase family DNA binding protein
MEEKQSVENTEYFTPKELAVKLNVSLKAVQKWTYQRKLPMVKIGRLNRYSRIEIEKRLLNGNLLFDRE